MSTSSPEMATPSAAAAPARPAEQLGRHAGALAAATLLSRLTGYLRDAAILAVFGTAGAAPWVLAWRLPNTMRRLVADGSLTVSFIPLFAGRLQAEGREGARRFLDRTFTAALVAVAAIVSLGVWSMPLVLRVFAAKWRSDAALFALAVHLARWAFPFLLTVTLVAVAMGVLNTLRRFFVPAASMVLVNLSVLAGALVLACWVDPPILALPIALLAGGLLQLAANLAALGRAGFAPRPTLRLRDPLLGRLGRLMLPATFGASIYQVNTLLSTLYATRLGDAPLSWLYAADRLVQLPLGVIAMSLAAATLPALSEHAAGGRWASYRETLSDGLRHVLYLILPAAAGLAVLAVPIVAVVLQRGHFTHDDTLRSAQALGVYALGLPAVAASRVTVQGFYALEDTRTPMFVGVLSVGVFGVSAWLLMAPLGYLGIALGVVLAAWLNVAASLVLLRRRAGPLGLRRIAGTLGRVVVGLLALVAAAYATARLGAWKAGAAHLDLAALRNAGVLAAAVLAGGGAYLVTTLALGGEEPRRLLGLVRRRLEPGRRRR